MVESQFLVRRYYVYEFDSGNYVKPMGDDWKPIFNSSYASYDAAVKAIQEYFEDQATENHVVKELFVEPDFTIVEKFGWES